ncbi:zinc finger protein 385B isoform X4 [Myxocyprinus asiaticus]|uniref:zinc finger protein 385B isoform X4 n=1 Tax=Myxocyprinus asiaticus TaxID=70543 RepID=UPI00222381EC|nr:zinc finger protein 385B isoform X4 [Myxocyprinus asiaticus]
MKTPLSPTQLIENGQLCFTFPGCMEVKDPSNPGTDMQLQQEKKKLLYSLCEVCNIQLHSAAQAQIHYNGKSHLKRVKQLNNGELPTASVSTAPAPLHSLTSSASQGSSCHSNTLPTLVRTPSLIMQSTLDMKPFMTFPVESSSPVGLFPNFNTMDPVQKAVINHTFGVSIPPKKKQVISCNICQLRFNSDSQAEAHYKGSKHAKKLKAQDSTKNKQKSAATQDSSSKTVTNITTTSTISCTAVTASSSEQPGSKHKTMLEARNGAGPIKAYPRPGSKLKVQAIQLNKGSGLQNKTFHCEICDVHVNSEVQLKQHISSRRHKDKVAGKPTKPKYSPYNKQQRSSNSLAAKLALQNDLVKPISPAFLPTPFSPTTVPSITLHPRPSTSIFQTATLPHSFLRAAPGPIRHTTGSILFAPY